MSNGTIPGLVNLRSFSSLLLEPQSKLVRTFFARELNNHIFAKAHSPSSSAELTEKDIAVLMHRLGVVFMTVQPSEPTHEDYAPEKNRETRTNGGVAAVEEALRRTPTREFLQQE